LKTILYSVKKELLEILKKKLGKKIAIVSGRGIESIRYSLEELLDEFDIENSIFLEDESRELAKPNPNSLIRTFKGIGSSTVYMLVIQWKILSWHKRQLRWETK